MKYLCRDTLEIDVDGMILSGDYLRLSKDLVMSNMGDDAWNLTIAGLEQRIPRLGNELFWPWISIDGIFSGDIGQLDGEGILLKWEKESQMVNRTYVTLMGEGFGLWNCRISLRRSGEVLHLELDGLTDFSIAQDQEFFPIRIRGYAEASGD